MAGRGERRRVFMQAYAQSCLLPASPVVAAARTLHRPAPAIPAPAVDPVPLAAEGGEPPASTAAPLVPAAPLPSSPHQEPVAPLPIVGDTSLFADLGAPDDDPDAWEQDPDAWAAHPRDQDDRADGPTLELLPATCNDDGPLSQPDEPPLDAWWDQAYAVPSFDDQLPPEEVDPPQPSRGPTALWHQTLRNAAPYDLRHSGPEVLIEESESSGTGGSAPERRLGETSLVGDSVPWDSQEDEDSLDQPMESLYQARLGRRPTPGTTQEAPPVDFLAAVRWALEAGPQDPPDDGPGAATSEA